VKHAVGVLGECVMSLYGIHRMLRSRDLGPVQILPSVEAFAGDAHRCGDVVAALSALGREAPSDGLREACDALVETTRQLSSHMGDVFSEVGKLAAKERLELERNVEPLGGSLQALRDLIPVVHGAVHPRPARLTLSELLQGRWRTRPAFVTETIELHVAAAHDQFEADPRVLWGLVERSLAQVSEAGVEQPFAALLDADCGRVLELGEVTRLPSSTLERAVVELGPTLPITEQVLDAVAHHIGADACSSSHPGLRKITVAA
jgi:hypothetical protein